MIKKSAIRHFLKFCGFIISNSSALVSAWALTGLIAVLARQPGCANATIGPIAYIIKLAEPGRTTTLLLWAVLFYLAAVVIFAITGRPKDAKAAQEMILRPLTGPLFFTVAGSFLGVAAPLMSSRIYWIPAFWALLVVVLAYLISNSADLLALRTGRSGRH